MHIGKGECKIKCWKPDVNYIVLNCSMTKDMTINILTSACNWTQFYIGLQIGRLICILTCILINLSVCPIHFIFLYCIRVNFQFIIGVKRAPDKVFTGYELVQSLVVKVGIDHNIYRAVLPTMVWDMELMEHYRWLWSSKSVEFCINFVDMGNREWVVHRLQIDGSGFFLVYGCGFWEFTVSKFEIFFVNPSFKIKISF